ncbi:MAG: helix-turn-helix domain-containing protein [Clostridia bacterium]|nr:helix-turn-helix domain-containing protein [Clostridia bacterium]
MNSVSKNIKKFRTREGISQRALAARLGVSEKTVWAWESDRSSPDAGMLRALSEALGVKVEELIYGSMKNVGFEPAPGSGRRTLAAVLGSLGALFTVVGLVMIFVYYWNVLGPAVRGALGFIPLIAGMAFGLTVRFKKGGSEGWREAGAAVWLTGMYVTNALINALFAAELGYSNLVFIDALLTLPVVFITDAVIPAAAYTFLAVSFPGFVSSQYDSLSGIIPGAVLLLGSAALLIIELRRDGRRKIALWLAAAAVVSALCVDLTIISEESGFTVVKLLLAASALMFCLELGDRFPCRFRLFAVPCAAVISCLLSVSSFWRHAVKPDIFLAALPVIAASFAIFVVAAAAGGRKLIKRAEDLAFFLLCALMALLTDIFAYLDLDKTVAAIAFSAVSFALATVIMVRGVRDKRPLGVNLGIVVIIADLGMIINALNDDLITTGLVFVAGGVALLLINRFALRKLKERGLELPADGDGEDGADGLPPAEERAVPAETAPVPGVYSGGAPHEQKAPFDEYGRSQGSEGGLSGGAPTAPMAPFNAYGRSPDGEGGRPGGAAPGPMAPFDEYGRSPDGEGGRPGGVPTAPMAPFDEYGCSPDGEGGQKNA